MPQCHDLSLPLYYLGDSQYYLSMAQGNYGSVVSPFSKRFLWPLLARGVDKIGHLGLPASFLALNIMAFALLAWCVAACLEVTTGSPWLAVLLLLTPLPLDSLQLAYMPDLFHMALIALFFLLLLREKIWPALLVLLVAFAARESTLLLCVACGLSGWLRRQRPLWLGSLAVLLLGTLLTTRFAALAQPNLHKLPEIVYLPLKLVYNFLLNFLGIAIRTNVTPIGHPATMHKLPAFLRFGADTEFGISFDWRFPASTLVILLTVFGSGPIFLFRFLRRNLALSAPWPIQLAFFYGAVCFLIGPCLGNCADRLAGYGWPVFWIALPALLKRTGFQTTRRDLIILVSCFVLICWYPRLAGFWLENLERTKNPLPSLVVLVPYIITLVLTQRGADVKRET
jgi:hypothetical protein